MPNRELQFTEGKSQKFWNITLKGNSHKVVYGRIGTSGRTLSKTFDTRSEAKASYTSLIDSKLKKGYQDVSQKKTRTTKKQAAKKLAPKKQTIKKHHVKKVRKVSFPSTIPKKKRAQPSNGSGKISITLNDLTRRKNMHHCLFGNKRDMADRCHYVWIWLLRHMRLQDPWIDVAVWEIGPTVLVRPACTALDESHRSFVRPQPLYFELKGYKQEKRKIEKQKGVDEATIEKERRALERELMERMQEAIVKGFQHKQAQKNYAMYNPDDRPFTVLVTFDDQGLHASEFTVVWKNRRGSSAAQIRKQVVAVKGKKPVIEKQGKSIQRQHLDNLAVKRKQEWKEYHEYWDQEKQKTQARKPAIHKKLVKQIEQAEAEFLKRPRKKTKQKSGSSKEFLFSLDDDNQQERILVATVTLDTLVEINATYPWANFDENDNRIWEYATAFMDPIYKKSKSGRRALWNKLNRRQKVFYVLLNFIGETDNGGVWQFLFNWPELSLAALEAMNEIGAMKLARDYRATLEEFLGKGRSLSDLRKRFGDKNLSTKKRWQAFAEGYAELKTAQKIQKYFYTAAFKKGLYKKLSDYIEESYHLFANVKT
ncbi:WGR domain protein [Symmachiella dynata]|uniref:WGR domain protein n=1 Tax=Symmachiella dynata TaxID=2527995 RepID=A0A517ZMJ5_9PLAN|nr:WGR domain-containing protein [Symmachiella dynata]QDU43708.1 WGR domain protein [Symmachiella dynata]